MGDLETDAKLLESERNILRAIASGASIAVVLELICRNYENSNQGVRCAVSLLEGTKLFLAAAPSIAAEFKTLIDGTDIDSKVVANATAASTNRITIVEKSTLGASWSTPINSSTGVVLGTLDVYPTTVRRPSGHETKAMQAAAQMAAIAIDKYRIEALLEEERTKFMIHSKTSAIGELASNIAHEINNPLTIITGKAALLKQHLAQKKTLTEDVKRYVESIEQTAFRISRIIKGLRSFSRDASKDPIAPVQLKSLIETTLELCAQRIRAEGIELTTDISETLFVPCREHEVTQALLNLVMNSLEALVGAPNPWIKISARLDSENIEISVTDSGAGIPAEIRDQIFNPFFTSKGAGRALGLGLAIANGVAESHLGRFWLDDTASNTRFVLTLPKEQPIGRPPQQDV